MIILIKFIIIILLSILLGFIIAQSLFFKKIGKLLKEIDKEQIDSIKNSTKDNEKKQRIESFIRMGKLFLIKELLKKNIIY